MEHRWSVRKRVRGAVRIDCPDIGPLSLGLRDVSLGGMCVEDRSRALPLYRVVKARFELPLAGRDEQFCADALVVRRHDRGAGLMFVDMPAATSARLRQALYETASGKTPITLLSTASGGSTLEGPQT